MINFVMRSLIEEKSRLEAVPLYLTNHCSGQVFDSPSSPFYLQKMRHKGTITAFRAVPTTLLLGVKQWRKYININYLLWVEPKKERIVDRNKLALPA